MSQHEPRSIRIPDKVWNAAKKKAAKNGEAVSAVVIQALKDYAAKK
jgi:predicted HicB family RNase H-like nuclease